MRIAIDCLLAFLLSTGIDFVYARWLICITEKRRPAACFYSAVCPLFGTLSLIVFLDSWFTAFPAALGHAFGTWVCMWREEVNALQKPRIAPGADVPAAISYLEIHNGPDTRSPENVR